MDGFVWSLMSTEHGGFLKGADVKDVHEIAPGLLRGTVIRNLNGHYKEDDRYEFWQEQFVPVDTAAGPFFIPETSHANRQWGCGELCKVYARQTWGHTLEKPINGTVYQNQISSSVLVSIHPDHFPNPNINVVGGTIIEVYPQQLRPSIHSEKHPICTDTPTKYDYQHGYFTRAAQYRKKNSWFNRLLN